MKNKIRLPFKVGSAGVIMDSRGVPVVKVANALLGEYLAERCMRFAETLADVMNKNAYILTHSLEED